MRLALVASVAAAFAAGVIVDRVVLPAEAQSAPPTLKPQIVNVMAMTDDEIGPLINNTDLRSRPLVVTEHGTVGIQSGNVLKHYHADAHEVQIILEGSGSFWLDDKEVQIKPGDLVVIPKGTHHAGSKAATGRYKAIAIKLPPQKSTDTIPVQ